MTEDDAAGDDAAGDDATDPFDDESLGGGDAADDADGIDDPFARLDEGEPEADPDPERSLFGEAKPGVDDRDPVDAGGAGADDAGADNAASDPRPTANAGLTGADDPFDELGPATGETDAELDEAFERMDVGGVAEEDVWESLDEDAAGGVGEFGGAASETGAAGAGLGGDFVGAGDERVISKRTYCQQCPHFSAPPEVACGHEGTTILEAVGFDEFRVRNCPMVDEDDPTFDAAREE
ncbi:hypothetical protein CK500_11940 [Halorubrum salipaludis]|uniref:DUF8135 domain-containing protein n=1 Tax=Halorubrum salipaludis TaxID=2032630 RepID=A0A2A2FCZ6_9EURY|nr:hypothetical protein [Halorubrum salipaludis]PAU82838.1 hypothetical protein CK500_11940 [Halorubrum salipaludis]